MEKYSRALMPDYLRLIALFGIVVVNVQYMAFSVLGGLTDQVGDTVSESLTLWLVNGLATLKTYGLFSFMFGVGLGFLMQSAERRDLSFGKVYRNRMIGLLVLGILHGCLFFPGDILVIYTITGTLLYLVRNWSVSNLIKLGAFLLILQPFIAIPLILLPSDIPQDIVTLEHTIMTDGMFVDAVFFRTIVFAIILPLFVILQGTAALGWFCLGLAAVRSGIIDDVEHPIWKRARRWCFLPGLIISLIGAGIWQWGNPELGVGITIAAAPISTLGYIGIIALISKPAGPFVSSILKAGRSSLTIYLGQSVVLSTLFSAFGFGLWGELDQLSVVLIAVLVTFLLVSAVSIWHLWFKLGPMEWVLRRITYARAFQGYT